MAFQFSLVRAAERLSTTAVSLIFVPLAVPIAILTSRKLQRVLLAIVVLDISLQVQKHFFLQEDVRDLGSLGGLQISLTNIALTGLCVAWLITFAIRSRSSAPQRRSSNQVTWPAALLLLFYTVSLLVAGDTILGVFEVLIVLELFFLYLYIAKTATSRADVLFIVRILLIALIIQSFLLLAQVGGLVGDIQFYGIKARAEFAGDSRISGTLGSPNPAAAYLAMMMPVAIGFMFANVGWVDRYLARIGLALATLPLIFTLSRGGWISFAVSFAILVVFGGQLTSWKTAVIVVMAGVLLVIPFRSVIEARLYGDDNGSAASRLPLNDLAGVMIKDHPLLGVGANNFAVAMKPYLAHEFSGEFLYTVHNQYLLVWTETGIGGLIAFVWFLLAIVRRGAKCWQLRDPLFAPLALGCTAAVIGSMVQMNFDPSRSGAANHLIWLFGGLIVVLNRMSLSPLPVPQAGVMAIRGGQVPLKLSSA